MASGIYIALSADASGSHMPMIDAPRDGQNLVLVARPFKKYGNFDGGRLRRLMLHEKDLRK
jgi:hypothetical protein